MASILDAFADTGATTPGSAGSFTVSAGSDRELIYVMHFTSTAADTLGTPQYGGESMTQIATVASAGGTGFCRAFRLEEAGIAAASDSNFTVSGGITGGRYRASAGSFSAVDQTTPVLDTDTQTGNLSSGTMSLAVEDAGFAIGGATCVNDTTFDWTGITERASTESDATMSYTVASGGTTSTTPLTVDVDTPSGGASGSTTRQCALSFSLSTAQNAVAVGLSAETDSAQGITAQRIVPVGLSTETDTAFSLQQTGTVLVGLATETDTALPILVPRTLVLGLAEEADTALSVLDGTANQVELVDVWTLISSSASDAGSGVTFSVTAGTSRMLVVAIGEESSTGKPTGVTYGGQAMTAAPRALGPGGFPITCQFFILGEAGIDAAVDSNVIVQGVTGHNGQFRLFASSYENVGQGGLVDSDTSSNSGEIAPPLTVTTTARGASLGMVSNDVGAVDVTWTAASEQIEEDASSTYHSISEQQTDGADITFTPTSALINNNVLSVISLPGIAQTQALGQAVETDTAQTVPPSRVVLVGQTSENDTAFSVTPETGSVVAVGLATETDSAQTVTAFQPGRVNVGQAVETDTAQPVLPARSVSVGQASETDSAQAITFRREVFVGQAIEVDSATRIVIPSQEFAAALARQRDSGSAGDFISEADIEARRRGALRRQIEQEDADIMAALPAIAKSLLNLEG